MKKQPCVAVLMSTYNGERFLYQQIESIMLQEGVAIHLYVHDDGSTDRTEEVLNRCIGQWADSSITVLRTANMGYPLGFYWLLGQVQNRYDWYAWADHDDVWLPTKLAEAVRLLSGEIANGEEVTIPALYGSSTTVTTEDLEPIYIAEKTDAPKTLPGLWARSRVAAHTMVFNEALKAELGILSIEAPDMGHDYLATLITAAMGGSIVFDARSFVLHRRSTGALSSGGRGGLHRLHRELHNTFCITNDYPRLAKAMLTRYGGGCQRMTRYSCSSWLPKEIILAPGCDS